MKCHRIKILFVLALICPCSLVLSQSFESRIMDIKSMQEELTFIQNKLNEVHPEPYHYISKADFEQGLARLKSNLKPMTKEQWYVELAGLIAALHDGHTGLYYPDEDRQKYFDLGGKTFPFWVNLDDDGRVVIRQQYLQDDRLTDAAILEINGKPIHEVIEKMYPQFDSLMIKQAAHMPFLSHSAVFGAYLQNSLVCPMSRSFPSERWY